VSFGYELVHFWYLLGYFFDVAILENKFNKGRIPSFRATCSGQRATGVTDIIVVRLGPAFAGMMRFACFVGGGWTRLTTYESIFEPIALTLSCCWAKK